MKKIEKILLGTILLFTICIIVVGYQFTSLLFLSTLILSICYIIGGFYLFRNKGEDKEKLDILSGIILGSSLSTFSYTLRMPVSTFRKILVLINVIFLIILIALWLYKKKEFRKKLKFILFRSLTIALITSFFSFSSIYFNLYRNILKRMMRIESTTYSNLQMFDKISDYKDLMNSKEYKKAIISAKQAIKYGKKWKNYDTLYYQDFSGAYEFLSEAYIKNGDQFFRNKDFTNSLKNYLLADSILTDKELIPKYPENIKSDLYWNRYNLLLTYNKLNEYENYDDQLEYLLENYSKVKDTVDIDYHYILEDVADNYYHRSFHSDAISINKASLTILINDSINNLENYKSTYIRLFKNYLITDSLINAETYLKQYEKIVSNNNCSYLYYKTTLLKKNNVKKALEFAIKSCECFRKNDNKTSLLAANFLLLKLELENSNYKNFEKEIQNIQKEILNTDNSEYNTASVNELLGQYNLLKGNYLDSKKHYKKALNYYKKIAGIQKNVIELKIAQINDELDIQYDKNSINSNILHILSEHETTLPSQTILHNDLGNINIGFNSKLSDSIFNITIACHKNSKILKSPKLGIAYNGLALNQFNRRKYKKADSLFVLSINTMEQFYKKNKSVNQLISFINIAESKLNQKKYSKSSHYLKKAVLTKTNCFKEEMTIYDAYILKLKGDLIYDSSKNKLSAIKNYNQALDIAIKYFDKDHRFIKELKNKINELNNER